MLRILGAVCIAFVVGQGAGVRAQGAEIVDLTALIKNKKVLVSFRMTQAFKEDIDQAIASGLPVSFKYSLELKKVRSVWMDAKVVSRDVATTVTYDNLTERYKLSRIIDGELYETEIVVDPNEMARFMTTVQNVELADASSLEPNGEYYVQVKGVVKERNLFLFLPWDIGSEWKKAEFTYLP